MMRAQGEDVSAERPVARLIASSSLRLAGRVRTQVAGPNFNRVTCNEAGDMYLRQLGDTVDDAKRQPLLKIRPDGGLASSFKIADATPDLVAHDFSVRS